MPFWMLSVSLDKLVGTQAKAARSDGGKRGPAPKWQQQIEAVAHVPKSQQQFVARMIKTVLAEAGARCRRCSRSFRAASWRCASSA
jgi:hypothetical protein